MDFSKLADSPAAEREDAILQLTAAISAMQKTLFELVAAHDKSGSWRQDGAASVAQWLVAACQVGHRTAAEWARVADAIVDLPAVGEAFGCGRLSYDHVRALTRFATVETDGTLAEEALGLSVAQLQRMARRSRSVSVEEAGAAADRRFVRWRWNHTGTVLRLNGELPAADGAVGVEGLERLANAIDRDPVSGLFDPWENRCAGALTQMASQSLGADADPDRATVVVHVDADVLTSGTGPVESGDAALSVESARRLSCDARIQLVFDGRDGAPVGIVRATRKIPPWLVRQLHRRDAGCVFPGCERTRWVHGHHIRHWAQGGSTDLDNLVTLCGFHHKLVHEHGWAIDWSHDRWLFQRPGGRTFEPRRQALRANVWNRIVDPVLVGAHLPDR